MKRRYVSLAPLVPWLEVARPIEWSRVFGAEQPLEVEIGFGNGEFLVRRACQHPDRSFLGLELKWGSLRRALSRIAGLGLGNVRLLQADARVALHRLFQPESVARFYSLFPCPWPKQRHAHHRLFSRGFLELMNSRLRRDGTLLIVTDDAPFRDEILGNLPETGLGCRVQAVSPRYDTKYERRWRGEGRLEFYELHFWKESHRPSPVAEDVELIACTADSFEPDRFLPQGQRGEVTVEFKDFLFDPVRQRAMVAVFASEPGLSQRFWVEIARRRDGRCWAIFPAPGCPLVPVVSVQRALELLRQACLTPGSASNPAAPPGTARGESGAPIR